jgi:death-on-curing protein
VGSECHHSTRGTFQAFLVHEFGGLPGLRDPGLLDSALARRNSFACGKPDMFDLAAAYAGGIVCDHPFLDGNKRTAFLAALVLLHDNGWDLAAPEEEVVVHKVSLAASHVGEKAFADWLRARSSGRRRSTRGCRRRKPPPDRRR